MSDLWHHYALYGLTLHSNRMLPGLSPARGSGDVVVIDGMTLLNTWESTVQITAHGKGMGK